MAQQNELLDFSGLFKLDVLLHLDVVTHSYYEVGLRKCLALSSDHDLVFVYFDPQGERIDHHHDWDFLDNPIHCMCFEPSGTWLLIVSEQKLLIVPYLPLFDSNINYDLKWSLNSVSVLPFGNIANLSSAVWWLTKESENILITASKNGLIVFYSVDAQTHVGETRVSGEITELQICFDDSLDLLTLLISCGKSQQWKLILEHRSVGYNWLVQNKMDNKKEGFINYFKNLSKDKLFSQGSKDENNSAVEYMSKPVEYLPVFRKGSNNWALTVQYVNGRHFLTAFELNEGTLILESPEEDTPSRTLRPRIKNDEKYIQGLWSQRIIYLLRKNELEIHSANFSVIQGEALLGTKRDFTELWRIEVMGDVLRAYLVSAKEPPTTAPGWREPTFLCDLDLPRFNIESCLIVTTRGVFSFSTMSVPCEWLVGVVTRGGAGAELAAAGLGAPVPALLRAAADMLLARGKIAPAQYLYSLSKSPQDGWVARLGAFGRLHELSMYKETGNGNVTPLGHAAITIKLLALLLKMAGNTEEKFDTEVKLSNLTADELCELSGISSCLGLWDMLPVFTIHRGNPSMMLKGIQFRGRSCRGAIKALLDQKCLVPLLIEENAQWLFHFFTGSCDKLDIVLLKHLCLWLNPLQDQLRPVLRDLKQDITTIYAIRLLNLITTFIHVASEIENREPCPEFVFELTPQPETWKNHFQPRRSVSCGLAHWAVVDDGNAKIMMTDTPVNTEMIGRVVDVACGRHHTLVLTENGVYAAGDNTYGQLGVGATWSGARGDAATASGALMFTAYDWQAPVDIIAAGHYHSAAVDRGGRLYTWGWGVHGQLALGTIDDHCTPQLVTRLQGRKVLNVGCGACHTVVLMKNGEVWACGAGVFGQLGSGARDKSSVPVRVNIPHPIEKIAIGYFHNLALTSKGVLYTWGSSPQQTRAAHARRSSFPSPYPSPSHEPASGSLTPPPPDPHLTPQQVDTSFVKGQIVRLAAGWHHSCLLNNAGTLYSWGLNFDGQLGTGDRKQVTYPKEVKILNNSSLPDKDKPKSPEEDIKDMKTAALVACGGDFTVYVDDDGKIYVAGNMHLPAASEKEKGGNRIIMMKTTKRVIKIPASKTHNKFLFQELDRLDIMFPFDLESQDRKPIEPKRNPLTCIEDFNNKTWANEIIVLLKPWITSENFSRNPNMAAKLAYQNKTYADCLRLLICNINKDPSDDTFFITHSIPAFEELNTDNLNAKMKDELKIMVTNVMSKRIKQVSLSILNEENYPAVDYKIYMLLPCCCNEHEYLPYKPQKVDFTGKTTEELSQTAANLLDKCIGIFPVDSNLWEVCFRLVKNFYVENKLPFADLEAVLRKYMETNAVTMAAAIMYSKDCSEYGRILTPKFYLNMCSYVMESWG